ncbi:BMP family ABC transporter substrate-binding protein [Bacillus coahuilensis]|uniref:BMP family ABC transporter substrate-binding protein n=1 Tax=Bacillus coahuilensis TaxID=408580 RepID=UPI0001850A98|nr:BMP family ABC transporter substrate-binding protein [Bacillus coahuilensis]
MKRLFVGIMALLLVLTGCQNAMQEETVESKETKIGILLSDSGLGDGSFNDSAFRGLEKSRDELGILFDYREAPTGNYEEMLVDLVEQGNDLVIGLGFSVQEALEKVAGENPEQQFLLIDGVSELENVISITFKEHEGSFLVGMVAAMTSNTGKIGFIGGADIELIHRFEVGYTQGAQYVNPDIEVIADYANNFGDSTLGSIIAEEQIEKGVDFIYPAAGFTGVGALQTAQSKGVYGAGVDSDQFLLAEKAVVSSMLKNVDVAVFDTTKNLVNNQLTEQVYTLGLVESGVGLAPIRVVELTTEQQQLIEKATEAISAGKIDVQTKK